MMSLFTLPPRHVCSRTVWWISQNHSVYTSSHSGLVAIDWSLVRAHSDNAGTSIPGMYQVQVQVRGTSTPLSHNQVHVYHQVTIYEGLVWHLLSLLIDFPSMGMSLAKRYIKIFCDPIWFKSQLFTADEAFLTNHPYPWTVEDHSVDPESLKMRIHQYLDFAAGAFEILEYVEIAAVDKLVHVNQLE